VRVSLRVAPVWVEVLGRRLGRRLLHHILLTEAHHTAERNRHGRRRQRRRGRAGVGIGDGWCSQRHEGEGVLVLARSRPEGRRAAGAVDRRGRVEVVRGGVEDDGGADHLLAGRVRCS